MTKVNNILKEQKKQNQLKKEIAIIKKKTPIYVVLIIFIMFLFVFFLEDKIYKIFGNSIYFIVISSLTTIAMCLVLIFINIKRIRRTERQIKEIGSNLYKLMKLENSK